MATVSVPGWARPGGGAISPATLRVFSAAWPHAVASAARAAVASAARRRDGRGGTLSMIQGRTRRGKAPRSPVGLAGRGAHREKLDDAPGHLGGAQGAVVVGAEVAGAGALVDGVLDGVLDGLGGLGLGEGD